MTTLDLESAATLLGISPSTLQPPRARACQRVGGECGEGQSETEKESGVSESYERIWLQCPNTDPENEWCGETTWCQDKINDDDVEYVRGDLVESLRQRVKELEEALKFAASIIGHPDDNSSIYIAEVLAAAPKPEE